MRDTVTTIRHIHDGITPNTIITDSANSTKYAIMRHSGGADAGGAVSFTGTGRMKKQVAAMSTNATAKGSAMVAKNSPAGME